MTKEIIHIGIVDDDALIVDLLSNYLDKIPHINIVLTANDGAECIQKIGELEQLPSILLMDLKMKGMDGIETAERLKISHPDIKIVILSSHYKISFMGFMMKTGVSAFAPKGVSTKDLLEIIEEVNAKGFFFMKDQLETIREQLSSKSPKPIIKDEELLSEREVEVLRLICKQKTAKEIGEELFITQRTVEGHKNNLFIKTNAKNIAGLVIYAIQNNFIQSDDLPII
jgi:DNA-binding NarL/FixJ family response regulator